MVALLVAADARFLPALVRNGDRAVRRPVVQAPCLGLALGAGLVFWLALGAVVGLIATIL
jgi:hypothetical protein